MCGNSLPFTIGVGPGSQLNIVEVIDASCGLANGSIEVVGSGGTTPYSYALNVPPYGASGLFQGLSAGMFHLLLIDAAGCTDTIPVTVNATGAVSITNIAVTNATCGQANGTITVTATGGQPPLMYVLDNGTPQASNVFNGVAGGSHTIFVVDDTGCQTPTQNVNVPEDGGPSNLMAATTQSSCAANTGTIVITVSGGVLPLMYSITGGAPFSSSNTFAGLGPGTYNVVVQDANGCKVTGQAVITTPNGPQMANLVATNTTCGDDNGTINFTINGGTAPIDIFIDGNLYSGGLPVTNLSPGIHDIQIIDFNGCSAANQANIGTSTGPDFDVYITPTNCGMANGQIELDGFNGTPPYMYKINNGPYGLIFTFTNLVSDIYTVYIKDAKGCVYEEDVFVYDVPAPPISAVNVTAPGCGLSNGQIEIIASGGKPPLTYSIGGAFQPSNLFTGVAAGNYTITVKDAAGCTTTTTTVVPATPAPTINNVNLMDTQCGQSTGSITILASGGVPPLTYSITGGAPFLSSNIFTGLSSGTYTVVVHSSNGCEAMQNVTINSTGAQSSNVSSSICQGDTIIIEMDTFTTAGMYDILIPGGAANGCDSVVHLDLTVLPLLQSTIQATICLGDTLTINGVDYTTTGIYPIDTVTAATGCDTVRHLDLTVNPLENKDLFITTCSVFTYNGTDYTIPGDYIIDTLPAIVGCDSILTLHLSISQYSLDTIDASICAGQIFVYNGMNFSTTGVYVLDTLMGAGGCDTILNLDLVVNPLPLANAGADMILDCANPSVTLDGSATGGTPLWTGPGINAGNENQLMPTVSLPGTYVLLVTSAANCQATDTVEVMSDPQMVVASAGIDTFLSCDVVSVMLHGAPMGPNLVYHWEGPGINASNEFLINPIVSDTGYYSLVVTDTVTMCQSLPDSVFIYNIAYEVVAIIQDPDNFDCYSTFLSLEGDSSTAGHDIIYVWFDANGNPIGNTDTLRIGTAGMYVLLVKDTISGCFDMDTVMVQDLVAYPPVEAGDPQSIDCNNPTVTLNEGGVNNLPNLIFYWQGPAGGILSDSTQLSILAGTAGNYYLFAMDTVTGCTNDDSVMVTAMLQPPIADLHIAQNITCLDSIALLNVGNSSAGPEYNYLWSGPGVNGATGSSIQTNLAGTYFLTVMNEMTGCESMDTASLTAPVPPTDMIASIEIPICAGDQSGSLSVTQIIGGTPVFMYSLDGGTPQTSPDFIDLTAGTYSVLVTDVNGCTYEESFDIPDGQILTIDIGPDLNLELGDSIILNPLVNLPWSQIDSLVWALGDHLSCTHCINPTYYALVPSEIITATVYASGCLDQDALTINVNIDADIYIPNVFTPNNDGINDRITVFTDDRVKRIVYLEIYDRWGNQVFVANDFLPNDPLKGWDGSFKGKPMNPAVFAYVARVELINGQLINKKGDITLIR